LLWTDTLALPDTLGQGFDITAIDATVGDCKTQNNPADPV